MLVSVTFLTGSSLSQETAQRFWTHASEFKSVVGSPKTYEFFLRVYCDDLEHAINDAMSLTTAILKDELMIPKFLEVSAVLESEED